MNACSSKSNARFTYLINLQFCLILLLIFIKLNYPERTLTSTNCCQWPSTINKKSQKVKSPCIVCIELANNNFFKDTCEKNQSIFAEILIKPIDLKH